MMKDVFHILIIFICILLLFDCKGDDDFISENMNENSLGNCDVDLGDFNLLPASLEASPYSGKNAVFFENNLGELIEFKITEKNILNLDGLFIDYNVEVDGDTVSYCYTVQRKAFTLTSEEPILEFDLFLEARPYFANIVEMQSADVLNLFYTNLAAEPERYVMIFRKNLAQRNYPVPLYTNNTTFESMKFLGKTFQIVEKTNYNTPSLLLYYNTDVGIVSFENDFYGNWIFSHFE